MQPLAFGANPVVVAARQQCPAIEGNGAFQFSACGGGSGALKLGHVERDRESWLPLDGLAVGRQEGFVIGQRVL